jgi:cytochrome-b5 reductase
VCRYDNSQQVDGKEEKRPYTPINQKDGELNLMIKSYATGKASKQIGQLKAGDTIEIMVTY